MLLGSFGSFWSFFFVLVISLLLSFGNHHFFCSCSANRLNPFTNFCIHLGHIPAHPPAPSLCIFRLVFPTKPLPFTQDTRFFVASQALELLFQRQWVDISRCISRSRSPPIPTTCLYYNFCDTSPLFVLCAGKCTLRLQPSLWGRRRKTPKEGAKTSLLPLTSLSPFSPNPSSLFPPFYPYDRSL